MDRQEATKCSIVLKESRVQGVVQRRKESDVAKLLAEIGMPIEGDVIQTSCDNRSCIYIVKNQMFHGQTKHIKVQYHFMRPHFGWEGEVGIFSFREQFCAGIHKQMTQELAL